MPSASYCCDAPRFGRGLRMSVTGRSGAPTPAAAPGESRRRVQARCDPLQPVYGCSRISKLVLRAAGRTDALRTLVTPLSHGTDSWRDGMADQLSLHQ